MTNIQMIGASDFDKEELETITEMAKHYEEKITHVVGTIEGKMHLKKHSKGGKSTKYDLRLTVKVAKKTFDTQESDWELNKTVHKVFKNIQNQITHKLHTDDSNPKS
tara:strand:+ start:209 stop:529 length:321 start_codon:yes stop_codon:yes gene_type:complete